MISSFTPLPTKSPDEDCTHLVFKQTHARHGKTLLHLCVFLTGVFSSSYFARAACNESVSEPVQELIQEERSLRSTEESVQASRTRLRIFEADLLSRLANPPPAHDRALARRLAKLQRTEVDPKRRTLENLRVQHEEARRQWERGHRQLAPQLVEARSAYQANMMTEEDFCRIRDTYRQALHLYLEGMQNYRRGLELYARALDEYRTQFIGPYISGFADPRHWQALIDQLARGEFLQEILVAMTVNAIRSVPPDAPPE